MHHCLISLNAKQKKIVFIQNVTEGETRILYSLYGIVEHSGTMRSGHYTAYVKVRPECSKASSNSYTAQGRTTLV